MWSKQNRMENSGHSDVLPPSLIYALVTRDPERAAAPLWGHLPPLWQGGGRGPAPGLRPRAKVQPGPPWAPPIHHPTLTPTSKSSSPPFIHKAILFLSEIWFDIYIHKHIYQHLHLYSDSTRLETLLPQSMTSWSTSFG